MLDEGWSVKWLWFPRRPFGMKPSAAGRITSASMDFGICRIPVGLKVSTWASAIVLSGGCLLKRRVARDKIHHVVATLFPSLFTFFFATIPL